MKYNLKNTDFLILKNFIDRNTANSLNNWCMNNYKKSFFTDANMGTKDTRYTTRFTKDWESFSFPDECYVIKNKIINELELLNFKMPNFKDGIVCGIGFDGGDIYEHVDPTYYEKTITLHCNILSRKSNAGGNIYINDVFVPVKERDLLCFKVSRDKHRVDKIQGDRERILWVFGFCIPENELF
jgi:hypothetical protein